MDKYIRVELVIAAHDTETMSAQIDFINDVLLTVLDSDNGYAVLAGRIAPTITPETSASIEARLMNLETEKVTSFAAGFEAGQATGAAEAGQLQQQVALLKMTLQEAGHYSQKEA